RRSCCNVAYADHWMHPDWKTIEPTKNDCCIIKHKNMGVATPAAGGRDLPEPWVTVGDVARHLGVVKDSIYRWIERRGLPAQRVGRLWKLKLSEVDEWVRRGGAKDKSPAG